MSPFREVSPTGMENNLFHNVSCIDQKLIQGDKEGYLSRVHILFILQTASSIYFHLKYEGNKNLNYLPPLCVAQ